MNRASDAVGFDRKIRLAWLDATAEWTAKGMSAQDIRSKLDFLLDGEVQGKEARKKTKTVLLRTWHLVPEELLPLRDEALAMRSSQESSGKLALHWGMLAATHPLVWELAGMLGQLLYLQGRVSVSQLRRRVIEEYGDRSTLVRASQRLMRSFSDWGVLKASLEKGVYVPGLVHEIKDEALSAWLVEAALLAGKSANSRTLSALVNSPSLFPFTLPHKDWKFLENGTRIELYRQNIDEDLVTLKSNSSSQKRLFLS